MDSNKNAELFAAWVDAVYNNNPEALENYNNAREKENERAQLIAQEQSIQKDAANMFFIPAGILTGKTEKECSTQARNIIAFKVSQETGVPAHLLTGLTVEELRKSADAINEYRKQKATEFHETVKDCGEALALNMDPFRHIGTAEQFAEYADRMQFLAMPLDIE